MSPPSKGGGVFRVTDGDGDGLSYMFYYYTV